jgi:hypothetical protein
MAAYRKATTFRFSAAHPILNNIGSGAGSRDPQTETLQILVPQETRHGVRQESVERAFRDFTGRHIDTSGTIKVSTG